MVGRDEALGRLRREVVERGLQFEFATVLTVDDGGPAGFLVRVRSGRRLHPHTLLLAADERRLSLDHSVGDPLSADDVESWTQGVVEWLTEQLATGVMRWGQRVTLPDGTVAIDPSLEPGPGSPWHVTSLPLQRPPAAGQRRLRRLARRRGRNGSIVTLGDRIGLEPDPSPGGHLHDRGFDVRPGRAAHEGGRLIEWLQLFDSDGDDASLRGQLVVSWRDESDSMARLEHLEYRPSAPTGAVDELLLDGLQTATDAGARRVEHQLEAADHLAAGLPWEEAGGRFWVEAEEIP